MRIILRVVFLFFLAFILTPFSSAYKASEHIEINFNTETTWTNIYTIPEGKDLVVYKIFWRQANANLKFRDNWWNIKADGDFDEAIYEIVLTFENNVEVKGIPDAKDFAIFWYLVSEDEDIENYLQWNSTAWNKHIFDKEDIDYIYFREFIIIFFLVIIKFFSKIIWRKINIF